MRKKNVDWPEMPGYTVGMSKFDLHDPLFFEKIGKLGGEARKAGGADYSAMAAASHPRKKYNGGRPKGAKNMKNRKPKKSTVSPIKE